VAYNVITRIKAVLINALSGLLVTVICSPSLSPQYLSCALVRGCGIVFRHYYRSHAKSAEKDFRDDAVVPFE
jgi:hypothetical protein